MPGAEAAARSTFQGPGGKIGIARSAVAVEGDGSKCVQVTKPALAVAERAGHCSLPCAAAAGTNGKPLGQTEGAFPEGETREAVSESGEPASHTSQCVPPKKGLRTRPMWIPVAVVTAMPGVLADPSSSTPAVDTLAAEILPVSE